MMTAIGPMLKQQPYRMVHDVTNNFDAYGVVAV
jgi:hypothetical protein